jgi:hypothetical protein
MPRTNILDLLAGADRRTIGLSDKVAAMVSQDLKLFPNLIAGLWSEDPLVRIRSADATEKVTRNNHRLLRPYRKELLGLMNETMQQELPLSGKERQIAASLLQGYLADRSSIVRTFALQGLTDLAQTDASIRPGVIETLREATRNGTPAMKARSRKLLLQFDDV